MHGLADKRSNIIIAFFLSLLFLIGNIYLITKGHFHEDAYILFVYVDNFINGHGITFFAGSEPIEGATDFLWLMMLVMLRKIGLDVGTSAILLNSIGVFIITFIMLNERQLKKTQTYYIHICLLLFCVLWVLNPLLLSAIGGFSVFLYTALILTTLVCVNHDKFLLLTPYLSIIIALFRPDGVIIGVGFCLIGMRFAFRKKLFQQYLLGCICAFFIGVVYFIWRYNYFDNLLPLPLYVKSYGSILDGVWVNVYWLQHHLYLIVPTILLSFLLGRFKQYLILSLPVIFLFSMLLAVTQSQNIGFRFQGPIYIVLYYFFIKLVSEYFNLHKSTLYENLIVFFLLAWVVFKSFSFLSQAYDDFTNTTFNYINEAAYRINHILPAQSTMVITEAGRMAYWNQQGRHRIIDLVGLNTKFPATHEIDTQYIEQLNPDFIMYHHVGILNKSDIAAKHKDHKVIKLDNGQSFPMFREGYKKKLPFFKTNKVFWAAITASHFLRKKTGSYDIFFVDYFGRHSFAHVYAIKKSLHLREILQNILEKSFNEKQRLSYYDLKYLQFRGEGNFLG